MQPTSATFKGNATDALADAKLQKALGHIKTGFIERRRKAAERLPEFETLRDAAKAIKDHTLAHLDLYLERYEQKVLESGGHGIGRARPRRRGRSSLIFVTRPMPKP